ncbi:MAG: hypothetical protein ISR57_09295, partial [Bacteroidales bacterium]|nr:hypothetical protein [Bacteroidales bacterium]
FTPYELSINWKKNNIHVNVEENRMKELVFTAILSFKSKKLDKIIAAKLKEMQESTDSNDQALLLIELKNLKDSSIVVNKELGRIITR